MATEVVKYSWQFGPYVRPATRCNHRQDTWPHNDAWAVAQCDGERDTCVCRECGAVREFRCDLDEEYK